MKQLRILDNGLVPAESRELVVVWKGKSDPYRENVVMLADYIESNANVLREQYLALIHDLGDRKIFGKTVVEYLQVRTGFSIWWMTPLAEKCNYAKSPYIEDIIRLMALQMYICDLDLEHIILESSDPLLTKTLKDWCLRRRIKFSIVHSDMPTKTLKSIINNTPQILLGLGWLLMRVIKRWPLKGQGIEPWLKSDSKFFFFSYSEIWGCCVFHVKIQMFCIAFFVCVAFLVLLMRMSL